MTLIQLSVTLHFSTVENFAALSLLNTLTAG